MLQALPRRPPRAQLYGSPFIHNLLTESSSCQRANTLGRSRTSPSVRTAWKTQSLNLPLGCLRSGSRVEAAGAASAHTAFCIPTADVGLLLGFSLEAVLTFYWAPSLMPALRQVFTRDS